MSVRVVDAGLVKDKTPQADRFLKNTYQATIAPGLPPLIFTTDYINDSRMFPKNYAPNASGIISGQGVYGPAGYTSSDRNDDVIVRFPAGSGASPLYISSVEVLNPESLHQRQLAETDIRNRIDAAIKAEENRKYLFGKAGIQETPAFTPEMVKSASALLAAPAAMMLNRAPAGIQLSATGTGVMTAVGEWAGSIAGALWRGAVGTAAASTAGPMVAAASTLFFSRPAGEGSDKVPGRDINMMAAQVSLFNTGKVKIDPGMKTVDLPVRGFISTDSNGRQSVKLVRTGAGGVPATVPVLSAVRDKVTGLDKITVPAVAGAPSRTILVNPVPVGPAAPSHTGNSTPVPVTPVHTGTDVKQADSIVTTTLPAADIPALQDFIYWQPDATGTGVEPIYVVFSSPPKSFSHGYKHYPPKGVPWKDIVKSTANGGEAKFKPDINIPDLDVDVWNTGQTTSLRSYWKVKQYDHIIGAYEGKETRWAVVKESQGVIHSHPISEEKAKRYIK